MFSILGIPKYDCQGIPKLFNARLAYMETWNERLKSARKNYGCTATELAKEIGVSNATVSDWENGVIKKMETENLLKICEFLKVSQMWLQFGRGDKFHSELTEDDRRALEINRMLGSKEKRAWYRAGNSLAEPDEGTNGK
jgi:transcriptional regulator with XRE-family HTH domain